MLYLYLCSCFVEMGRGAAKCRLLCCCRPVPGVRTTQPCGSTALPRGRAISRSNLHLQRAAISATESAAGGPKLSKVENLCITSGSSARLLQFSSGKSRWVPCRRRAGYSCELRLRPHRFTCYPIELILRPRQVGFDF